jgi:hypothetical protein
MVTIVIMIMVIMATIMLVITLMIVTGSAKAVSVRCADHLGYRGGAMLYSPECVEWGFSEVGEESCNKYCN